MDSLQLTLKLGKTLLAQQRTLKFQLAKLQFQAQQSVVSVESLPEQRGAKSDGIQKHLPHSTHSKKNKER